MNAKKFILALIGIGALAYAAKSIAKKAPDGQSSTFLPMLPGDSFFNILPIPGFSSPIDEIPKTAVIGSDPFLISGTQAMTRGERNNNPGNIEKGSAWQGLAETQTDSRFAQFVSPEYGIRALAKVLLTYYRNYQLNTVRAIISRWAPTNENDTNSYINTVSRSMGVGPDQRLWLENENTLLKLASAIIHHENGRDIYTTDTILAGVQMALRS